MMHETLSFLMTNNLMEYMPHLTRLAVHLLQFYEYNVNTAVRCLTIGAIFQIKLSTLQQPLHNHHHHGKHHALSARFVKIFQMV